MGTGMGMGARGWGLGLAAAGSAAPTLARALGVDTFFRDITSILFAVPKKKRTYRRRKLRWHALWLKPNKSIRRCPHCGEPTLLHHVCKTCLRKAQRAFFPSSSSSSPPGPPFSFS
ncbi:hypothetical protein BJ742DRAFT_777818 [Cladochytrium replicatum]|nr:hypothetical protein BJ742DRAFT_777818 [Cladochytrium replicatum]